MKYREHDIAAIIYHPCGKAGTMLPHSVFTLLQRPVSPTDYYSHEWDFDWCETYGSLYFHESGMGPEGIYLNALAEPKTPPSCAIWTSPLVRVTSGRIPRRFIGEATMRRYGYAVLSEPLLLKADGLEGTNPFELGGEAETEFCARCADHLPSDSLCAHIWWCEKCGTFSTPQDRCKHRRSR